MLATQCFGEGKDLVFIHGWRAHSDLWRHWIESHFVDYRVTLIDLPGHGNSDAVQLTDDQSLFDDWMNAIAQVLPENSIVVGWSLGGLLAQELAVKHPQRVRALILIASSPCFVQREDWLPALSRPLIHHYLQEVSNNAVALFKSFFMLQSLGSPNPRRLYQQLTSSLMVLKTDISSLKQGLTLLEEVDLRAVLPQVKQPTLWLLGEKDAIVPIELWSELALLQPQALFKRLVNCGHLPFMTCPDELARNMNNFLVNLHDD